MNYKTVWGAAGIAVVGAMALSVSAQAADLGGRRESYKEEPVYSAPSTWSGAYFGGHLGASWTSGSANLTSDYYVPAEEGWAHVGGYNVHKDLGETSFLGGIHGGVNWQAGAFVYGFEGDVSFANNIDYLASIRGRLGVAAGNWLFYGTGGVGFVSSNVSGTISDGELIGVRYDVSNDQTGFVVGGGAEVKLTPNWSLGVEGLYYGFDGSTKKTAGDVVVYNANGYPVAGAEYGASVNSGGDIGVVRGRLSYHFNRGYEPLK